MSSQSLRGKQGTTGSVQVLRENSPEVKEARNAASEQRCKALEQSPA